MLPASQHTTADERRLLRSYKSLDKQNRQSLIDYAEFLVSRVEPEKDVVSEPLDIPRPESESVVKGIKRLTTTYPMIDKGTLFNETSSLMSQHIMQGREAAEVIDELEELFKKHFESLAEEQQ